MLVVLTPASGGQPVVLGFGSGTSQGAINLAPVVTTLNHPDLILIAQAGVLKGISFANLLAAIQASENNIALES